MSILGENGSIGDIDIFWGQTEKGCVVTGSQGRKWV